MKPESEPTPLADQFIAALTSAGLTERRSLTVELGDDRDVGLVELSGDTRLVLVTFEGSDSTLLVPASALEQPSDERGVFGLAVRLLTGNRVGRAIVRPLVGAVADLATDMWERRHRPARLRRYCPTDRQADEANPSAVPSPFDPGVLGHGRSLLLLHDQLATAERSFRRLDPSLHDELANQYEGRIWAYDHPSIGTSPAANANHLIELIASPGRETQLVDIIAVGRGGLVAHELIRRRAAAGIEIGNVVLMGTPNAGTPLADPANLTAYANRLANILALGPDPVSDIGSVIASIVATAADTVLAKLPGIAALAPRDPQSIDLGGWVGPLTCVAADYDPTDGSRLATTFADWALDHLLDGDPNDLFVPRSSAAPDSIGGVPTTIHDAGNVAHGAYLTSPTTTAAISGALVDNASADHHADITVDALDDRDPFPDDEPATHDGGDNGEPIELATAPGAPTASGAATAPGAPTDVVVADTNIDPPADAAAERQQTLRVSITHGSLEHARHPLIIGHQKGTPTSGAEDRIDRCLGGELSRLRMMRRYAGNIGEAAVVDTRDQIDADVVTIAGLGVPGELTPSRLIDAVTAALIDTARHIQHQRRTQRDTNNELAITIVPIGSTTATGLTIDASVRSILAGFALAQQQLIQAHGKDRAPRFVTVEFIERYADRAEVMAAVLGRVAGDPSDDQSLRISYNATVAVGEGAAPGAAPDDRDDAWRRIAVTRQPTTQTTGTQFVYTAYGARARSETITNPVNPNIIDPMIASSIKNDTAPDISRALYELLIPHEMKDELAAGGNLHLIVDKHTAYIPWELITPESNGYQNSTPLALRCGVLRQFNESENLRMKPRSALSSRALVIGNPPTPPGYISLPGATREATTVANVLQGAGWQTTPLIWDEAHRNISGLPDPQPNTASWIHAQLVTKEWRIVHIAAHGQIGQTGDDTGVVLENSFITTDVLRAMAYVPDLVFVNACHLGSIAWSLDQVNRSSNWNEIAASVARTLMRVGVRAVVVAGWAVSDNPAADFAEELYEAMLMRGATFGEAVASARRAAYDARPTSLTWGAYQCYGDPGFRLSTYRPSTAAGRRPATDAERRRRIGRILSLAGDTGRAGHADGESHDDLIEQLDDIAASGGGVAEASSDVLGELAEAYAEVGAYDQAIACHRAALRRDRATAPVRCIEQLGNLLTRQAVEQSGSSADTLTSNAVATFDEALATLTLATTLGLTAERLGLLAGHHKKRAVVDLAQRRQLLTTAAERYQQAADLAPDHLYDTTLIHVRCVLALLTPETDSGAVFGHACDRFEAWKDRVRETRTFWDRAAVGDIALADALINTVRHGRNDNSPPVVDVVAAYHEAFRIRSSSRHRDTVTGHVCDLARLLESTVAGQLLAEVQRAVEQWPTEPNDVAS